MLEEDAPKIYGLDDINTGKTVYVTEGPFDSTFISNSIAMCGADGDVSKWGITNPVWIYDNEPRNRQIVERLAATIDRGDRVVIFPKNILEKDINDMYLSGQKVQRVVDSNIYQGLESQIKITRLETSMSNGIKVVKRAGHIEPLDLEKMHKMVELAVMVLQGYLQVKLKSNLESNSMMV